MAVHDLADTMSQLAQTVAAGVIAGAVNHWLGQKPTDLVQWRRRPATEPASRAHAYATDGDVEELHRRAI